MDLCIVKNSWGKFLGMDGYVRTLQSKYKNARKKTAETLDSMKTPDYMRSNMLVVFSIGDNLI